MKKISVIYLCILSFQIIYGDLYNNLFMRDLCFILDSSEHIGLTFNDEEVEKGTFHLAQTDKICEMFYYQPCPFLTSQSLLKHFFELIDITKKLLETDSKKLKQTLKSFEQDNILDKTILRNQAKTSILSTILREMKKDFELLERENAAQSESHLRETTEKEINKIFMINYQGYTKLSTLPFPATSGLLRLAYMLFKYYLAIKKTNLSDFEVYDIDQFTALVIPKSYLEKTKEKITNQFANIKKLNIDNIDETSLGINYKNLKQITDFINPTSYYQERFPEWHFTYLEFYFMDMLNKLFKPKNGCFEKSPIPTLYLWNILFCGHGSENTTTHPTIIGMKEITFYQILNFFRSINTNIMFAISCHSAGKRIEKIKELNLPYILALASITDTITYREAIFNLTVNKSKELEIQFPHNMAFFFELLRLDSGRSYFEIFNYIKKFWKLKKKNDLTYYKFYQHNIPQLKLPYTNWFQIVDLKKNEFILNKLLLDLHTYYQKPIMINNKRLLFLHTRYKYEQSLSEQETVHTVVTQKPSQATIHPTVIFGGRVPLVISMETENAKYHFASIKAPNSSLADFALKFMGMPTQVYARTFNINQLTIKKATRADFTNPGPKADACIFFKAFSSQPKLNRNPGPVTLLKNISIKVRPKGQKPTFRIKFEFNDKRFIIQQPSAQGIRYILKAHDLESLMTLEKSIIIDELKPSKKYALKPWDEKNFKEIEAVLNKHTERHKRLTEQKIYTLRLTTATLNNLAAQDFHCQKELAIG